VLVAGGSSKSVIGNDRLDSAELFDPTTKTFTVVGKMAHVHAFHVSILLPSGSVLIAGGNPENLLRPNSPFVERWDPKTSGFVEMAPMGSPRAAPFVVPLADGRSLITGGFGTVALASTEILTALAGGTACKSNSACESGVCRDGVCCDRACDGACEACDAKGACQFVTSGSPKAGHTCDGYACSSDAAGAGVCRESCTEDGHCATGFFCSKGKCEPDNSAKCTADHTRTRTDDGVEVSCGAYLCEDLEGGKRGRCRSQCASTGECAPGSVCNLDTASCDPGGLTPSGASCALGPADGGAPIGLVGVGAALTLAGALRRRRRA
jgi:Cys-rich repeat protein